MSGDSCNSSPRLDCHRLLKGVSWINLDYPDANNAMLEGIRNGVAGYQVDKIIVSGSQRTDACSPISSPHSPSSGNELTDAVLNGTPPNAKANKDHFDLKDLEDILIPDRNMSLNNLASSSIDLLSLKKKSTQALPKCTENKSGHSIKESVVQIEHEVKSDSESTTTVHDDTRVDPVKRTSGNWIVVKTKGRKRKSGK